MSSDSLAMFRRRLGPDLGALAEEHLQHDLTQSDRDNLRNAASAVKTYATWGSLLGLGLGFALAYRIRANRVRMFTAFKAVDKPVSLRFANGREEAVPDFNNLLQPSRLGDFATFTFLGFGGLFLGGETGLLSGSFRAKQFVSADAESRKRIENAFRAFHADALRRQANLLDQSAREGRPLGAVDGGTWL